MALSATDYQALLTADLDLTNALNARANAQLATCWAVYADKAYVAGGPRLQFLYAKLDLLDIILKDRAENQDYKEGVTEYKDHEIFESLTAMRQTVADEIEIVESRARANRPGQTGYLTSTTPIAAPGNGIPDPNARRYRGDPFFRSGRPW